MAKSVKRKTKKLILGDDAIESSDADWLGFKIPATELAKQLYEISKSSGVCCGIVGRWGSGKSSFMKLMNEYIRKESGWKKVDVVWFTAWDPGGLQDLGDAMLYHFFRDIAEGEKDMVKAFQSLQEALRIRKSLKEHARRVLEDVSEALPTTGRAVTKIASGLIGEFDSPIKVQRSFQELMDWLEKEDRAVFFFIDDLCRATGEQIRDLLSELKLYISHRRIVAVLAYDEDYVLSALKPPVLPHGIDPKKYLEKIITIKRNVPVPKPSDLFNYATHLINSASDLKESREVAFHATILADNNPRRLKNIILTFVQLISNVDFLSTRHEHTASYLTTALFVSAVTYMGFLTNLRVRDAIEFGTDSEVEVAIKDVIRNDPSKSEEGKNLIRALELLSPMSKGILSLLRLYTGSLARQEEAQLESEKEETFDWSHSLIPILGSAAMQGFKSTPKIAKFSQEITVPPLTKTKTLKAGDKKRPEMILRFIQHLDLGSDICLLSWKKNNIAVLTTSSLYIARSPPFMILDEFFNNCAQFAAEGDFALWIIDDRNLLEEVRIERLLKKAQKMSKGLRHMFIFQYTPRSKITYLVEFLLNASRAK